MILTGITDRGISRTQASILSCLLMVIGFNNLNAQNTFSLDEAVLFAIENSNTIKLKQLDISTAAADVKEFKAIGMPVISGSINYQYYFYTPAQPVSDFITPSVYDVLFDEQVLERRDLGPPDVFEFSFFQPNQLNGGIEASALVFDGSYLVGLKAAKVYKDLVAKELNATEQDIRSNVTKAYMAVLIAQENMSVIENNIRNIDRSLRETKILYDEGFAESLDVDRLTLSFNNLNTEFEKLQGLIKISKNLLKFHMGYPITKEIELSEDIELIVGTYDIEKIAIDDDVDYSQRAEYDVLTTSQELNRLDLKRNKAGYLPSIRVFASAQESLQRQNLFDGKESGWLPTATAGIGINIPIYDGGEKSARIQKAKINLDRVDIQMEEFKKSVDLQAYNARLALFNAKRNVSNTRAALDINERIYNKTQIKFREGVGSSVEVTQSEASLYQAQGAYINALYDLVSAKTDLDIALGKL